MHAIIVFFIVFLILAMLKVPIAFSLLMGAILGYTSVGLATGGFASAVFAGLDSFPLLAIPAFIFAGDLMGQGGISAAIMGFINSLIGRFRGALGAVMVVVSALFGSITGSSVATVSAIGGIMIPEMDKAGYSRSYITALLAASGFLGILIPPSVPGILYALSTGQKVTEIWMCTLVPGIVLAILYCINNYFVYGRKQPKTTEPFEFKTYTKNIGKATPKALVAFMMPVIIFAGVYGGAFTATEAGIIAVAYGLLAGWVIFPVFFKSKSESNFWTIIKQSAMTTASISIIISIATLIGRMISLGGIATAIADALMHVTDSQVVFLILVNIILILVGMFMETTTAVILFSSLLAPIAQAYGIDLVHFGAIMLLNLEIGMITPPYAGNIFVACKMTKAPFNEVIRPLIPYYVSCLSVLIITTFVPQFSMWLPGITG